MGLTSYHTINGRIRGQSTSSIRTDFVTDALGSVTGTVDLSANIVNTYRSKPYGEPLAKTGSSPDPRFMWTGDTGSRWTSLGSAQQYNRARHYSTSTGSWNSIDHLWPTERAYAYCLGNPSSRIDPSGWKWIRVAHYPPMGASCTGEFIGVRGDIFGYTFCNWETGKPYSCADDDFKILPCVKRHEAVHVGQIDDCCKRLKKCIDKKKYDPAGMICASAFNLYMRLNTASFECDAYKESLKCANDMLVHFNCASNPTTLDCDQYIKYKNHANTGIKAYCTPKPKTEPCIFDPTGDLPPHIVVGGLGVVGGLSGGVIGGNSG